MVKLIAKRNIRLRMSTRNTHCNICYLGPGAILKSYAIACTIYSTGSGPIILEASTQILYITA